jgi:hypothetical protein
MEFFHRRSVGRQRFSTPIASLLQFDGISHKDINEVRIAREMRRMVRKNYSFLIIPIIATSLLWSGLAKAQSCGAGYIQHGGNGVVVCEPIVEAPPADVLQNPGPQWVTRWGAISVDLELGKFGGAQGLASKGKAEKAANKDCERNGGNRCRSYS